jgi:hypothetical protein
MIPAHTKQKKQSSISTASAAVPPIIPLVSADNSVTLAGTKASLGI